MTLRERQSLFAKLLGELLVWIYAQGWEVTMGDANRPDLAGHMPGSCHFVRLACDLNLFVSGVWQTKACPEWDAIGVKWESMHTDCRWGGRFAKPDQNHVSITYLGRS